MKCTRHWIVAVLLISIEGSPGAEQGPAGARPHGGKACSDAHAEGAAEDCRAPMPQIPTAVLVGLGIGCAVFVLNVIAVLFWRSEFPSTQWKSGVRTALCCMFCPISCFICYCPIDEASIPVPKGKKVEPKCPYKHRNELHLIERMSYMTADQIERGEHKPQSKAQAQAAAAAEIEAAAAPAA